MLYVDVYKTIFLIYIVAHKNVLPNFCPYLRHIDRLKKIIQLSHSVKNLH